MNKINDYNKQFKDYLLYRNYGKGTVKSYERVIERFLDFCRVHNGQYGEPQQYAYQYMLLRKQAGLSSSTINIVYSALKLFFKQVLKQTWSYDEVPRPKHLKMLPRILSTEEVVRMLHGTNNAKHQTILLLLYTCGLRVGELIGLRVSDLRFEQGNLWIRQGKGHRDRIVDLPEIVQQGLSLIHI